MSKLERLLNLIAALLETGRPLLAEEIHERIPGYPESVSAFHRAFERDKEDLRELGIPLALVAIPGSDPPREGYQIPKSEYYLPDPGLEPDELAALHLAAGAVQLDGLAGVEALWKLGGRPTGAEVEGTPEALLGLPTNQNLVPLFSAVVERRVASFNYHGQHRELEPYRLDFRRGRWIVTGYDRTRGGERVFRVDRIESSVDVGERGSFAPPERQRSPNPQPWELGLEEPVAARLSVDADQAILAVQHLGRESVLEERPDGSMTFQVQVTNRPAFRSFVITFLEHAEILGPEELREEMLAWLEAMAQ